MAECKRRPETCVLNLEVSRSRTEETMVLAAHAVVYRLQTQRNLVHKRVLMAECKRSPETFVHPIGFTYKNLFLNGVGTGFN
jgi:hypothetical protein